jgi:hypothetical protein
MKPPRKTAVSEDIVLSIVASDTYVVASPDGVDLNALPNDVGWSHVLTSPTLRGFLGQGKCRWLGMFRLLR